MAIAASPARAGAPGSVGQYPENPGAVPGAAATKGTPSEIVDCSRHALKRAARSISLSFRPRSRRGVQTARSRVQ